MTDSGSSSTAPTPPSAERGVLLPALARLGLPVLIFGMSFLVLSLALTVIVSPDRFPVRVGDKIVRLSDLQTEEYTLKTQQAQLLDERAKLLQDSDAPVLTQAAKLRSGFDRLGPLLLDIENARESFIVGSVDPISIPQIDYDGTAHTLTLGGTVTDPNGRSVSILSTFVDALRKIPLLQTDTGRTSVSDPPAYTQTDLPGGGTSSPFTVVITLPHAS